MLRYRVLSPNPRDSDLVNLGKGLKISFLTGTQVRLMLLVWELHFKSPLKEMNRKKEIEKSVCFGFGVTLPQVKAWCRWPFMPVFWFPSSVASHTGCYLYSAVGCQIVKLSEWLGKHFQDILGAQQWVETIPCWVKNSWNLILPGKHQDISWESTLICSEFPAR